jgi:hypothetical protein
MLERVEHSGTFPRGGSPGTIRAFTVRSPSLTVKGGPVGPCYTGLNTPWRPMSQARTLLPADPIQLQVLHIQFVCVNPQQVVGSERLRNDGPVPWTDPPFPRAKVRLRMPRHPPRGGAYAKPCIGAGPGWTWPT